MVFIKDTQTKRTFAKIRWWFSIIWQLPWEFLKRIYIYLEDQWAQGLRYIYRLSKTQEVWFRSLHTLLFKMLWEVWLGYRGKLSKNGLIICTEFNQVNVQYWLFMVKKMLWSMLNKLKIWETMLRNLNIVNLNRVKLCNTIASIYIWIL